MSDHRTVRKAILEKIENGSYLPGEPIDSLRALAHITGSSIGTVGRAVTHLVSEGYLRSRKARRFVVSQKIARINGGLQTVGLLATNMVALTAKGDDEMFRDTAVAVQAELNKSGVSTLLVSAIRWFANGSRHVYLDAEELAEKGLQGLLVLGIYDVAYLRKLRAGMPVMTALDIDASSEGVDSVAFDNQMSAVVMVKKLAEMGARKIAFVGGPRVPSRPDEAACDPCAKERFDGWRIGMNTAGLTPDSSLAVFAATRGGDEFRTAVAGILKNGVQPDAILTEDLAGTAAVLNSAGGNAGGILLAGWSSSAAPAGVAGRPVDLVAVCDFREMGKKGVDMLVKRFHTPDLPVQTELIAPRIEPGPQHKIHVSSGIEGEPR